MLWAIIIITHISLQKTELCHCSQPLLNNEQAQHTIHKVLALGPNSIMDATEMKTILQFMHCF